MSTQAAEIKIHVFERAGLGLGPFKFIGCTEEKFQAVPGDPNCPIQPGTSCDYCGQAIMLAFHVRSADGKRFKVGCDCIGRAGDGGLKRAIAPEIRKRQHSRDDERIEAARSALDSIGVAESLALQPHPYKYMADRGHTLLGFVQWNMANAGRSGRVKAARVIERAARPSQSSGGTR